MSPFKTTTGTLLIPRVLLGKEHGVILFIPRLLCGLDSKQSSRHLRLQLLLEHDKPLVAW